MRTRAANQARSVKASILNELRRAPTSSAARGRAAEHLHAPHQALAQLAVGDFVQACKGIGRARMLKTLRAAGVIDPTRRLGDLTPRERDAIADQLTTPWPYEQGTDPLAIA